MTFVDDVGPRASEVDDVGLRASEVDDVDVQASDKEKLVRTHLRQTITACTRPSSTMSTRVRPS